MAPTSGARTALSGCDVRAFLTTGTVLVAIRAAERREAVEEDEVLEWQPGEVDPAGRVVRPVGAPWMWAPLVAGSR